MDLEGISLRKKWLAGLEPENVHMMIGRLSVWKMNSSLLFLNLLSQYIFNGHLDKFSIVVGSMTIDCLGILTELSDCERKLFPVGYQ